MSTFAIRVIGFFLHPRKNQSSMIGGFPHHLVDDLEHLSVEIVKKNQ